MPLSPKVYTWLCGVFAALGSVTFGYDLGIIASVLVIALSLSSLPPLVNTFSLPSLHPNSKKSPARPKARTHRA
jgi:hypothetical protein